MTPASRRSLVVAALALALCLAAPSGATGGTDAAACAIPRYDDRCETWTSAPYDGGGGGSDTPEGLLATRSMVVSPDGETVYVTGMSDSAPGSATDYGAVTLAYDTADGQKRWVSRFEGPWPRSDDRALAVATSPDGSAVYTLVAAFSKEGCQGALLAYDARTGVEEWRHELDGCAIGRALAVAPDSSAVYLAGTAIDEDGRPSMGALALSAAGDVLWRRLVAAAPDAEGASGVVAAVSADGGTLYLGGAQRQGTRPRAYMVAAVRTHQPDAGRAGEVAWTATDPITQPDGFFPSSGVVGIAVTPDNSRVYVTGDDPIYPTGLTGQQSESGLLTYAHDTQDGALLWRARHDGADPFEAHHHTGTGGTIAVSPDGQRVFVTGLASRPLFGGYRQGSATVAYDAAEGRVLWQAESSEPAQTPYYLGTYALMTVSPDGETVFATSVRPNPGPHMATVAWDATTGEQRWVARYGTGPSFPRAIAADPTSNRVYVGGTSKPVQNCALLVCAPTPFENTYDIVVLRYDG